MTLFSLLSLLDQIFEWSRLRVDENGFSLRGWFRNQQIKHHEIEDFELVEYAGKKLLAVILKKSTNTEQSLPFPCCFGHPVEEVLKMVRSQIDRTPRPRSSN